MEKHIAFLQKDIYLYSGLINYKKMNFMLLRTIILGYT